MRRRMLQWLLAAILVTGGVTGGVASPAFASVGGCHNDSAVNVCVNWGDSGWQTLRADFYYTGPFEDGSFYSYEVWFNLNGGWKLAGSGRLGPLGHYCCWTRVVDNLPDIQNVAYVQVEIFTYYGSLTDWVNSPSIVFIA